MPSHVPSLICGLAIAASAAAGTLHAGNDALSTRWEVVTLGGAAAVPGGDISFDGGRISGATACNRYGGTYATSGEAGLTITLGMMTRRGCHGVALEREQALIETFAATRGYRIDGTTLVLTGADGKELATLRQVGNAELEGPRHKIVSFLMDGGLHSTVSGSGAIVSFKGGAVEGSTGCRTFAARYTLTGTTLAILGLAVTGKAADPCPPELESQDGGILEALPQATTFDSQRNLVRLLEPSKGWAVLWITPAE